MAETVIRETGSVKRRLAGLIGPTGGEGQIGAVFLTQVLRASFVAG